MSTVKRTSKAEIRRLLAARQAGEPEAPPLPTELAGYVNGYRPNDVDDERWATVRPFVIDVIRRYEPTALESTRQRLIALSAYVLWAQELGYPIERSELLRFDRIEAFCSQHEASATTLASYRSRLRGITKKVNPRGTGSGATVAIAHKAVKPPYTTREIAQIVRIAQTQPSVGVGRQMRACVGLGLGAGLDASDLRRLHGRDVIDAGEHGIEVVVTGPRERKVWVRIDYEPLVRRGVEGLPASRLVIGEKLDRRNAACAIFERAVILGDAPNIEQSRLRTTWLASLLNARLPLPVIMDAAGLKGARTLTDLLEFIAIDGDATRIREVR